MKISGPVFLTGLMGSGKSTVGRLLAKALGWRWVDLDDAIEAKAGKRVAVIFATRGEAAFRRLESQTLKQLSRQTRTVVSCGGGAVLAASSRQVLKRGLTLYLAASPVTLAKRLRGPESHKRPLLQGQPPLTVLRRLQRERARFYRACASFTLQAAAPPPKVAARALNRLRSTLTP